MRRHSPQRHQRYTAITNPPSPHSVRPILSGSLWGSPSASRGLGSPALQSSHPLTPLLGQEDLKDTATAVARWGTIMQGFLFSAFHSRCLKYLAKQGRWKCFKKLLLSCGHISANFLMDLSRKLWGREGLEVFESSSSATRCKNRRAV